MKPKKGDNDWLGVHGVGLAKLLDNNNTLIATCSDTPNAIACAVAECKPHKIIDMWGQVYIPDQNRVIHKGWMTLDQACYKKITPD